MDSPSQQQQELNHSFDSSIQLDELSLTQTTNSIDLEKPRGIYYEDKPFMFSPLKTPQKGSPISRKAQQFGGFFVGFKNGWGGKEIVINQSKIKKAKRFFDDSQIDIISNQFSVQNINTNLPKYSKISFEQEQPYSMPCFKTVGSGAQVKISDSTKQQVSNLFKEFQSIKKPTKMKKNTKFNTQSMVKTYNIQSKIKPQNTHFSINRKSFNWQEYQKQYKDEIQRQIKHQTKQSKRITQAKRKQSKLQQIPRQFVFIKLYSLTLTNKQESRCSQQLSREYQQIQEKKYTHQLQSCHIIHCVLCKIKHEASSYDLKDVYKILNEEFTKKWITFEHFITYYHQVCFKLIKYSIYWPTVINKTYHLSNILIQINKKSIITEKQAESSFLRHCVSKDQIGRKINLIVKHKLFNQKMNIVYINLSDGWTSIWAAIQQKNLLFPHVKNNNKLRVGSKLSLSLWNFHPISNILEFCSQAKDKNEKCIQFFYNGSIILQPNAKLGYNREQFYRPLNKCKAKGGLIPVTEGTIIRLFTLKQSKKNKNDQFFFSNHYAQLLTPQGFTCLIKFILNQQSSLVEYFRLYHYYRLYKLKINEENILTFLMNQSKYEQITTKFKISQKQQLYPPNVIELLKKRLLNCRKKSQWKEGIYDVLCSGGKVKMSCGEQYEAQVQGQSQANGSSVYQQVYVATPNPNPNTNPSLIHIRKLKQSSQLRKLPKIYQNLASLK